ncbi:PhzF family phenazine biosynthesis protein [Haloplasma contractile]|uniref:Phenazine biosynthesis protein PhzF family protein n=1 Tax=Haloplasma contractile SSD-17B TaxID=1033810 RepID=U2EB15_9MOLU|nr:PhzF family phenazine biosynthesis isomerase [Haloplasma contractile]ERJ11986.1 Phenazine biosynthesis protein PhzF family protein [Haloplasma contractile SSD-17B]
MKTIKLFTVDAFTTTIFNGNAAGVVLDSDHLETKEMHKIAGEINLSETAFLSKPTTIEADYRIRYFTPTDEIDFCGHATVAASWIIGTESNVTQNRIVKLETEIGIVPVELHYENETLKSVVMTQVPPQVKELPKEDDYRTILEMSGIKESDYEDRYPIKLAYTGNWDIMIPVKTRQAIDEAVPDFKRLKAHNKKHGIASVHLFTFDTREDDCLLYTRDFSPAVGIDEDPVTGSANGALAGYLVIEGILEQKQNRFKIMQGNSKGRIGTLDISTDVIDGNIRIQVSGSAVRAIVGSISF